MGGPVDNSTLLDDSGDPRPGLKVEQDYRGVNFQVWTPTGGGTVDFIEEVEEALAQKEKEFERKKMFCMAFWDFFDQLFFIIFTCSVEGTTAYTLCLIVCILSTVGTAGLLLLVAMHSDKDWLPEGSIVLWYEVVTACFDSLQLFCSLWIDACCPDAIGFGLKV